MNLTGIIGVSASIFTAASLLPQLIKLIKEKKPENVSIGMLVVLFIGLILWIWYGGLKHDWIIIIANSFSLLVNITIMVLGLIYKNKK